MIRYMVLLTLMVGLLTSVVQAQDKIMVESNKMLIVYYSWSGNTKAAAEQIQKMTGGDLFEITPVKAYPTNYKACVDQAKKEINEGFKPELATKIEDIKKYDVVFIGSPNWWSTIAPPVATFLTSYDLSGKTVIPFITHGGGGMARCEADIKKLCGKSNVLDGRAFSGSGIRNAKQEIEKWVTSILSLSGR